MYAESEFDEVVLFAVPAEHVEDLYVRLLPHRLTWQHRTDEGDLLIVAALRVELDDLARLLRDAQAWLADSNVPHLTFILDGREYELRASAGALAA